MSGLYLSRRCEYIERVSKQGEELSLLAKGDGVEVMTQKILPGLVFSIDPGEDSSLMEFFYILDGKVLWDNGEENLEMGRGDYYYVQDLKEPVHFRTLSEVSLLYVASQPVFHLLSNEIEKLTDMLRQVEKKDMYTHEHDVRLKDYSVRIGEKLRLSQKQLDVLFYAASFHDIGKINVPDEILKKPGKLTKEEFEYIKKHPLDGVNILINTFIKESVRAILEHHERLDGSGYPHGLKEDGICLEAKIIAVVDTYDAMTSDRPYRKGIEPNTALEEIKGLVGRHYDQRVVECLEEILKEDGIVNK